MKIPFKRRIKAQVEAFDDDGGSDGRRWINMYQGGYGAGKSFFLTYKLIKLSAQNKGVAGGLLSPSLPEFKRDMLPLFLEAMQHIPGSRYYSSGRYGYHFSFPWTSAPLFVFTAERPVKGPNLGYGGVNEHSLMHFDRVREFLARMRVKCPVRQVAFAGTPEDEFNWLDDFVKQQEQRGRIAIRTATSFDNPYNAEGYADDLLANLDEKAAQVYVYGIPGRLDGDFFFYAYKPSVNDYPIERQPGHLVHVTLDFNVGRMTASFGHVLGSGDRKQIVFFDELLLEGNSGTEEMGRAILARYDKDELLITCDASGKNRKTSGVSDVRALESLGLKVRYKTVNPRIRRSQLLVNGLLARRKILLNPDKCPLLKRDMLKVKQKPDYEMDKSRPELTHSGDGVRYLADWEFNDWLDRDTRGKYNSGFLGTHK